MTDEDDFPLRPIHVDAHLIVLDKPSGLLTVPAKPPGPSDCLEERVRAAWPDALLVHRLDRDTSGVILFARTRLAQRHLGWQFERRQVAKAYVARVAGIVTGAVGCIELPLACDWPNRPRQMVTPAGRPALTEWEVMAHEGEATQLRLEPLTGRSHQLRVHLANPVIRSSATRFMATQPLRRGCSCTLNGSPFATRTAGPGCLSRPRCPSSARPSEPRRSAHARAVAMAILHEPRVELVAENVRAHPVRHGSVEPGDIRHAPAEHDHVRV